VPRSGGLALFSGLAQSCARPIAGSGSCLDRLAADTLGGVGYGRVMRVPDDIRYSAEHEWVRPVDDGVRVGITDYAQDALGDIVYVDLPPLGKKLEAGGMLGEVESTKSVSEIYAPVAGTVVAVNERLSESPELMNSDPYGDGWICELRMEEEHGEASLLDAAAYRQLTEH